MDDEKTNSEQFGPIDIANWSQTPCLKGLVATEKDTRIGTAVFYLQPDDTHIISAIDMPLPCCAIHRGEEGETPVIVIQAESGRNERVENRLAGYRFLNGGCGLSMLEELEFLDGPDERFTKQQALVQ